MMKFLPVFLLVATIKCISGRNLLDHQQSLQLNSQDERKPPSSLLKKTKLEESSDSTAVESHGDMKSSVYTKSESSNQIHAFLTTLYKLILKRNDIHMDDIVGKLAQLINKSNLKSKNMPTQNLSILSSNHVSPVKSDTSTTLDPWDEFCKEACEEGFAGPECDCPEHPIG